MRGLSGKALFFTLLAFAGCGGDGDGGSPVRPEPTPAAAGVCAGEAIQCELPEVVPLEPGPEHVCEPVDLGAAEVVWRDEVTEIPCPIGTCKVELGEVAAAPDGGLWATAGLHRPELEINERFERTGIALLRYDGAGQRSVVDVQMRQRLGGRLPSTGGLHVDEAGHFDWLAPANGAAALELRRFDAAGQPVSTRLLMTPSTAGTARFADGGTLLLAYQYALPGASDTSPDGAGQAAGLASFHTSGDLIWNQSAFEGTRLSTLSAPAWHEDGRAVIFLRGPPPPGMAAPDWIAGVGSSGTVEWVREVPGYVVSALGSKDGPAFVIASNTNTTVNAIHAIDIEGKGRWSLSLPFLDFGITQIGDIDRDGRLLVVHGGGFSNPDSTEVMAIASDGGRCERFTLDVSGCVELANDEFACASPYVSSSAEKTVAFVVGTWAGVARVPKAR